jgi:hypothetical protein
MESKTVYEAMLRAEEIISNHCDSANPNDWWILPDEIEKLIEAIRNKKNNATNFNVIYNQRYYKLLCKREDEVRLNETE